MADVLKRVPVREQDPKVRATNFEEVCYGYNQEEAMEEATPVSYTHLPDLRTSGIGGQDRRYHRRKDYECTGTGYRSRRYICCCSYFHDHLFCHYDWKVFA